MRSRLWLLSAGFTVVAATLLGSALAIVWRPCADNLLTGSLFSGYRYVPEFTDGCLVAMDTAPGFPLPSEVGSSATLGLLGLGAALALAASWLVLVPTFRASWVARGVFALPGLLVLAVGMASALLPGLADAGGLPAGVLVAVELAMIPALFVLAQCGVEGVRLVRYAVVLLAATAMGLVHQLIDVAAGMALSEANWDTPPGTGWFGVLCLLASAVCTVVLRQRDGGLPVRVRTPVAAPGAA